MTRPGAVEFQLWSRSRWPALDVVGEQYRVDDIRSLLPRTIPKEGVDLQSMAQLSPEPANRHDPHAVKVTVQGHHVGYLPRQEAAAYSTVLTLLERQGMVAVAACQLRGREYESYLGTDRRGKDRYEKSLDVDVSLVVDSPQTCVPVNLPPAGAHRMLPVGHALQLRGEEKHLDVLVPLVGDRGEVAVHGTLHAITTAEKSPKDVVEVRVDGRAIGSLTPAMSAHYLPVIRHLDEIGALTAAQVYLKGNRIKVEAVLHAQRAHELDEGWVSSPRASREADRTVTRELVEVTPPVATRGPVVIPPKPSRIVFNTPPGWAPPPKGWEPAPGWAPPAEWPPPPPEWTFWVAR